MTFQVTGSPYNAPIPYGVTVHPFANITVADTNTPTSGLTWSRVVPATISEGQT
jgi:hypothetical protein